MLQVGNQNPDFDAPGNIYAILSAMPPPPQEREEENGTIHSLYKSLVSSLASSLAPTPGSTIQRR